VLLLVAGACWLAVSAAPRRFVVGAEQKIFKVSAAKGYAVKNLLVQGRVNIDPDVLRGLIDVKPGDPILAFDPVKVRDSLKRLSWVKDAQVERRLPDTIYIRLTERRPLALWQDKGKVKLIDEDGVTLAEANLKSFGGLPLVVGDEAPRHAADLLRLLAAEPALVPQVEASTWVGGRRWDLALKKGITVQLPSGDAGLALRRLAAAQTENALLDKDISVIDLREDGRMTVRTKPGAVKELKTSVSAQKSDI
jgi:cell division protein FtsQ